MTDYARWPLDKANAWYAAQPWLVGCNFTPSTAINQLEMWQEDTFDPITIGRELGWAHHLGFNTVRVYLHDLLWAVDQVGFVRRIDRCLAIAASNGIRTLFVIFDDCWNKDPRLGKQPAPKPGVHNSGWVQSPGEAIVLDSSAWPRLERYVTGLVKRFADDDRILAWDLYNEPGNSGLAEKTLPLLQNTFAWARAAGPKQPLTCGIWFANEALNTVQLAASDIISFHHYGEAADLETWIAAMKEQGRPVLCTEYMARPRGSRFQSHLPIFRRERVGCLNWGLVSGKTQTIYPWGSPEGAPEPEVWFHDIYRRDGAPFDPDEITFIRGITLP
jgi:hypothetical protein